MWKCKKCKEEVEDQFEVCWNCGSDRMGKIALDDEGQTILSEMKSEIAVEKSRSKYPALRTISGFFKLFAYFVGIAVIISSFYFFNKGENGLLFAIPIIVIGILTILSSLAISESILVLIDIEYNTRQKSKMK